MLSRDNRWLTGSLCSTTRFWSMPVSTYIVVRSLQMNGCMNAVLFSLLVAECLSSGYASVSLRVGSVIWTSAPRLRFISASTTYCTHRGLWRGTPMKCLITDAMNFVRAWLHVTSDAFHTVHVQFPVHGAAGHNRWRVVETPLPVKTSRQEHGPRCKYVAGCRLMATAHDEAGCSMWASERSDIRHAHKV